MRNAQVRDRKIHITVDHTPLEIGEEYLSGRANR